MNNEILFSIPGFYGNGLMLTQVLLDLYNNERYKFNDNIKIDSVYDSFPCIFNGGRVTEFHRIEEKEIYAIINYFNKQGIQIRNVFTNQLLNLSNLQDPTTQLILKVSNEIGSFYNIKNGCTIHNKDVFKYIHNNYNIQTIWSTTLEIHDIDKINELSKDNVVIVSYTFNNNFDLIKQFQHPENIEFLCFEEGCIENCPMRTTHTLLSSYQQLGYEMPNQKDFYCPKAKEGTTFYYSSCRNRKYFISYKDMQEKYLPLGFNKFKIAGRMPVIVTKINLIEYYIDNFIKSEYQNEIRNKILIYYLGNVYENNIIQRN